MEYTDRRSGARADRTAFQKVFEDARLKKFDLVLFWALDRFSREGVTETLNYLKVLDGYGVAWKSFMESYLDSTGMFKEAVIAILAAVAKQEHARLSERVVAGLRRAKREGRQLGRPKVVIDREKLKAARSEGLSLLAIGSRFGISCQLVANLLNGDGRPQVRPCSLRPSHRPLDCPSSEGGYHKRNLARETSGERIKPINEPGGIFRMTRGYLPLIRAS